MGPAPLPVIDASPELQSSEYIDLLPQTKQYRTVHVVLIKPSKYDDDGYVIRFWKGVLPSNTLSVLNGLTEDVKRRGLFGDIEFAVDTFDETTEKVPVKKIVQWGRRPATKLIVCLVGVQTNQFPRALDLGKQFRAHGIDVIMGGFHTSGTVNMLGPQEPDIQELIREGIVVVSGEIEGKWEGILADVVNGQAKPLYSFAQDLKSLVDIEKAPHPVMSPKTMQHFARPTFGTVDTSRGCPFACTFCTIINVQGRTMRERSSEEIAELVRRNHREHGVDFYFFTDDNFARKKLWRETFEVLIRIRQEGIPFSFAMQVDLARKPKDFVRLAAEAGCSQVFIGMESVNPENLKAGGKPQNKTEEYASIIREWHEAGVYVHAGYIIGLPFDTKEQVPRDVQYLMDEIHVDMASFFMLTPLPGSHDHLEMKKRGEWMDPDFNKRDSFHPTVHHPHMTAEEWTEVYENAWKTFFSKENLIKILSRWSHNPGVYWNLFVNLIWYKNAALIEKEHPMIAGFFRLKDRRSRRPGFSIDSLPVHLWKRTKEVTRLFVSWARYLKELEEVWLQTRPRSEAEKRFSEEIQHIQGEIWQTLKIAEWQQAYNNAKTTLPARARALLDPFDDLASKILISRKDLDAFLHKWGGIQTRIQKIRGRLVAEDGTTRRWLDQLGDLHKEAWNGLKIQEWREAYSSFREGLPSKFDLRYIRFDPLSNRVIYSRQDLHRLWVRTWEQVRSWRFWNIRPLRLAVAFFRDLFLTASFARRAMTMFFNYQ
ncbi:MAG: radical SAM protein [Candidatus Methylomirabilales bacterium]|nr:radical SAM protein [candidate division NC10 bacterium]